MARALARDPADRFESARAFAAALEQASSPASARVVSEWLASLASAELAARAEMVRRFVGTSPPLADVLVPSPELESAQHRVALSVDTPGRGAVSDGAPAGRRRGWRIVAAVLGVLLASSVAAIIGSRGVESTSGDVASSRVPASGGSASASNAASNASDVPAAAPPGSAVVGSASASSESAEPIAPVARPGHGSGRPAKPPPAHGAASSPAPTCRLVRQTDPRGIITFERVCN